MGNDLQYQSSTSAYPPDVSGFRKTLPCDPEKHNQPPLPRIFDVRKVEKITWKVAGLSPEVLYLSEPSGGRRSPPEGTLVQAGRLPLHLVSFSKNIQTELLRETGLKVSKKLPVFAVPS